MNTTNLIVAGSMCFSVLLIDGILLGIIFFTRRKVEQASNWPSTMGMVLMSTLEARHDSEGGYTYYPVVQYEYRVMGQPYQGNRIMPGPSVGGSGANKVVARYPAGTQVTVYYDPNNPSDAVLERGMPVYIKWLWVIMIVVDVFMCGLGTFLALVL